MDNVGSDAPTLQETRDETSKGVWRISADYVLGEVIGRGGMADVVAARDQRIGREVAIKRMRGSASDVDQVARFMREARVQARLDHPAIVPVYEIGSDGAGVPYFAIRDGAVETMSSAIRMGGASTSVLLFVVGFAMLAAAGFLAGMLGRSRLDAQRLLVSQAWHLRQLLPDSRSTS